MTSANSEGVQALNDAIAQLDAELTAGLNSAVGQFDELKRTIASLSSLNEQERQALDSATESVRAQLARTTQAFSSFKADDNTPVDPTPVPDPEPVDGGATDGGPVTPTPDVVNPGPVTDVVTDPTVDPATPDPSVDPGAEPTPGSSPGFQDDTRVEPGPVSGGDDNSASGGLNFG
jgi:hypothetical protein